jgi:hypothetical protein
MKMVSVIGMVIIASLALASATCFAQEDFSEFRNLGTIPSSNLTSTPGKSLVFFDLPLGKYRFDTSLQVEQWDPKKISPAEDDRGFDQNALSLQFSIRW